MSRWKNAAEMEAYLRKQPPAQGTRKPAGRSSPQQTTLVASEWMTRLSLRQSKGARADA